MELHEFLKDLRKEHNKTQREVAAFLGMTESGYGFYEQKGKRKKISLSMIQKLSSYYSVPISYFSERLTSDQFEDDSDGAIPDLSIDEIIERAESGAPVKIGHRYLEGQELAEFVTMMKMFKNSRDH